MWDLIVSVPDHCLSFYFVSEKRIGNVFHRYENCSVKKPNHFPWHQCFEL